MFNRTLSALAAVALTGATVAISSPAAAQSSDQVSAFVKTGDLDLSTAAGAERFEVRLRNAAEEVCGEASRDLRLNAQIRACTARITSRAHAEVDIAMARKGRTGETVVLGTR